MALRFCKYHALGNDYLVLDPAESDQMPSAESIRQICHRNFGLGSDGILYGPLPGDAEARFGLRIFNPDGSEAEKSGNGLRIFARYIYDRRLAGPEAFRVRTPGGVVACQVSPGGRQVFVEMGQVSFRSREIPVLGEDREVLGEEMTAGGRTFRFCAATIGNPHCVIPLPKIDRELACRYGPEIERLPIFPNRTNVQFMQVIDRSTIAIEIWERGAGYTLASGSSSSAAAAVALRLGLVDRAVEVRMPGGRLQIDIGPDFAIAMTGPVSRVGEMLLDAEALSG